MISKIKLRPFSQQKEQTAATSKSKLSVPVGTSKSKENKQEHFLDFVLSSLNFTYLNYELCENA
jgi:hypothetical protein